VAALGLSLSACGGGGSTATTTTAVGGASNNIVQLAGVVVDGYMKGATAFVDRNNNGQWDVEEPKAVTDIKGAFILTGLKAGDENYPIVVDIPATAIDSDTGKAVGKHSIMNAPAPKNLLKKVVVSPITTLIKTVMDNTPNTDKYAAAAKVKKDLNLANPASVDLFADYVAAKKTGNVNVVDYAKIHKVAQVIARTVANQVDSVKLAAAASNTAVSLSDVISLITAQVVNQLVAIDKKVTQTAVWTLAKADSIAVNDTVPLDTYSASFAVAIQKQITATQAAAKTAKAAADLANTTAQAALAQAKIILAQAQQLQDQYAASISTYTYVLASSAANKVAADPYATVTQKAAATAAVAADPYATAIQKTAATSAANLAAATPVITLKGNVIMRIAKGSVFLDPGSVVTDDIDKNLKATVAGTVNTQALGSYILFYNVTDSSGNKASPVTRTVTVIKDTVPPTMTYTGAKIFNLNISSVFKTPSVKVTDNIDKNLTATVINLVNVKVVGTYTVTYNATDSSGNSAIPVVLTVKVTDQTAPVISLLGSNPQVITQGSPYLELYAMVKDNYSQGLVASINATAVNTAKIGTYTVTYNAKDAASNAAKAVMRMVKVIAKPVGVTLTLYDESIWYKIWSFSGATPTAAQQQKQIAKAVIAGAKIVVDNGGAAKTYTTDVKGQVTIPGIDVGLHDIAMFADGFVWAAISQVTFDPAKKNQFSLAPSQQQGLNNGGNSRLLLAINLPAVQPAKTVVELSIADAYSNMVYTTSVRSQWNSATQTSYIGADFLNISLNPGVTISGVMTAREITCDIYGMNCTETNAGSLGKVSFVTQSWNAQQAPAGTVNVTYAATHVNKPVASNTTNPMIALNVTNSYASPGTFIPTNQWPSIQVDFTYTDAYGNTRQSSGWGNPQSANVFDVYGTYIGNKVLPGPMTVQLWNMVDNYGNLLPVGTTVAAMMVAKDTYWDPTLNQQVVRNVVNLGLQTITIQASPYPGFPAQPLPASTLKTQITANFPATPLMPTMVLTVQSIVPPTGIVNQGMGVDNWQTASQQGSTVPFYSDYVSLSFVNRVQQAMTFPHVFTSYQTLTGNLNFYASGSDTYSQARWNYDTTVPVGAIVSYAAQITMPLNVSPYQTGNIIKVTPVNGGALTTGATGLMMYDAYTGVQIWNINVPSNVTSIILPTVPAGIVNHMVKGKSYLLDVDTTVFTGAGSPTNMTQLMYTLGVNPFFSGLVNSSRENYVIPNIPYKY